MFHPYIYMTDFFIGALNVFWNSLCCLNRNVQFFKFKMENYICIYTKKIALEFDKWQQILKDEMKTLRGTAHFFAQHLIY